MYDIDKWIETKDELKTWAADRDLRDDWHDAEVADIEIRAVNGPLNNAFCDATEAHIVLIESNPAYTVDPQVTFAINAANLLAWACE